MRSSTGVVRKRVRVVALAATLAGFAAAAGIALSAVQAPPEKTTAAADTPELARVFPKQEQRADYVVVLDRSLSMKKYWAATQPALATFLRAIPAGDHLSFVTFSKEATNTELLPRTVVESARGKLVEELVALGPPKAKQGSDAGDFTDLGLALEAVLAELNRPNANRLQFVFLLTDFVHEPASGSKYTSANPADDVWHALSTRGKAVREGKALQSFAIVLPVDGRAERDLGLAESVLGRVLRVRSDAQTLGQWFERRAVEIERAKYALLAATDIARGWSWQIIPDGDRTKLVLRSSLERLTVDVAVSDPSVNGQRASVQTAASEKVAPRNSTSFVLDVEPCRADEGALAGWVRWLISRGGYAIREVQIRSSGRIAVEPASELAKVDVPLMYPLGLPESGTGVVRRCGAPIWLQGLLVALILGGIVFSWRTWLRAPARLQASFRHVVLSGPGVSETLEFPKMACAALRFGSTPSADLRCSTPMPEFELTFASRRPGFPRMTPARGVYVHRTSGEVFYRGREYDRRLKRWVERDVPVPTRASASIRVTSQTRLKIQHDGQALTIALRF